MQRLGAMLHGVASAASYAWLLSTPHPDGLMGLPTIAFACICSPRSIIHQPSGDSLLCAGGQGMRMLNEATGEVICQSNVTYGSGPRGSALMLATMAKLAIPAGMPDVLRCSHHQKMHGAWCMCHAATWFEVDSLHCSFILLVPLLAAAVQLQPLVGHDQCDTEHSRQLRGQYVCRCGGQ